MKGRVTPSVGDAVFGDALLVGRIFFFAVLGPFDESIRLGLDVLDLARARLTHIVEYTLD